MADLRKGSKQNHFLYSAKLSFIKLDINQANSRASLPLSLAHLSLSHTYCQVMVEFFLIRK